MQQAWSEKFPSRNVQPLQRKTEVKVAPRISVWQKLSLIGRHPNARAFIVISIAFLNFLIYMEDPIAHSETEAELPLIGSAGTFLVNRYKRLPVLAIIVKAVMALAFLAVGILFGKRVLHDWILRKRANIQMFSEDKGSFFIMAISAFIFLYIGAQLYNMFLQILDPDAFQINKITDSLGIHNQNFMKLAATGTWMGDLLTMIMVLDAMLQDHSKYAGVWVKTRSFYNRGNFRILFFWSFLLCTTALFLSMLLIGNWESTELSFMPSTTEYSRALLASFITLFDLLIVIQDWQFPTFESEQEVKIMGTNLHVLDFKIPILRNIRIVITGKWFNYGIIFCVMGLDLNMFKNQLLYRPSDYGQYVGPDRRIYTVSQLNLWKMTPAEIAAISYSTRAGKGDAVMRSRYSGGMGIPQLLSTLIPISIGVVTFFTLIWRHSTNRRVESSSNHSNHGLQLQA